MRISRATIISAIFAIGAAGSVLTGSAVSAATASPMAAHVAPPSLSSQPNLFYHA